MAAVSAKLSSPPWLPSKAAMSLELSEAFMGVKTQPLRSLIFFLPANACGTGDVAPKVLCTGAQCEFRRIFN